MLYDPSWEEKQKTTKLDGWRKVLWDAADVIEKKGWVQHKYRSPHGYCLKTAINAAGRSRRADGAQAAFRFNEAINNVAVLWNDQEGRTKEEVIAKLREVALA